MYIKLIYLILISSFLTACGGGGGGGGGSSSSSSRFDTVNTTNNAGSSFSAGTSESYQASLANTWAGRSQFDNILYTGTYDGASSSQNPYEVMNIHKAYAYGLSGEGTTIFIQDGNFDVDHQAFTGKTITAFQTNYTTDTTTRYHGNSVASVALGNYNSSYSSTMMGVAYNADLYFADYSQDRWSNDYGLHFDYGLSSTWGMPSTTVAYNNSWGIKATIDEVKSYKNANNFSVAKTLAAYLNAAGMTTDTYSGIYASGWIDAMNTFQDDQGVIVWALGNSVAEGWDQYSPHFLAALPELEESLKQSRLNRKEHTENED